MPTTSPSVHQQVDRELSLKKKQKWFSRRRKWRQKLPPNHRQANSRILPPPRSRVSEGCFCSPWPSPCCPGAERVLVSLMAVLVARRCCPPPQNLGEERSQKEAPRLAGHPPRRNGQPNSSGGEEEEDPVLSRVCRPGRETPQRRSSQLGYIFLVANLTFYCL